MIKGLAELSQEEWQSFHDFCRSGDIEEVLALMQPYSDEDLGLLSLDDFVSCVAQFHEMGMLAMRMRASLAELVDKYESKWKKNGRLRN